MEAQQCLVPGRMGGGRAVRGEGERAWRLANESNRISSIPKKGGKNCHNGECTVQADFLARRTDMPATHARTPAMTDEESESERLSCAKQPSCP